jgi:ribose-phosphate pyrophosphokinase
MHNKLTFRLNSYEDLWILNQIHDVVKSAGRSVTVTIPFLIDSQADRRFSNDQPHGLKLVCNFLNGLTNFNYKVFHPHNAEVVEALLDRVEILDNKSFINSVLHSISELWRMNVDPDNLILMSSDAGGFKPLMKLTDKLKWQGETFSASKSRKYEDGHSKLVQQVDRQDFGGKDILIIDDICVYGGTFKGLAKMLRERNCGKLYLAVSHMTMQELGEDPVTNYFDRVFTTNSKFDHYFMKGTIIADKVYAPTEIIKIF